MSNFCIFTGFENVVSTVKLDLSWLACTHTKNIKLRILNDFTALNIIRVCSIPPILCNKYEQKCRKKAYLVSNDIYSIFVGHTVSEILMKSRHLLTLIIHGKGVSLCTKYIYIFHSVYSPKLFIYRLWWIIKILIS